MRRTLFRWMGHNTSTGIQVIPASLTASQADSYHAVRGCEPHSVAAAANLLVHGRRRGSPLPPFTLLPSLAHTQAEKTVVCSVSGVPGPFGNTDARADFGGSHSSAAFLGAVIGALDATVAQGKATSAWLVVAAVSQEQVVLVRECLVGLHSLNKGCRVGFFGLPNGSHSDVIALVQCVKQRQKGPLETRSQRIDADLTTARPVCFVHWNGVGQASSSIQSMCATKVWPGSSVAEASTGVEFVVMPWYCAPVDVLPQEEAAMNEYQLAIGEVMRHALDLIV